MKKLLFISLILASFCSCKTTKKNTSKQHESYEKLKQNDTVRIANDDLEYEIYVIEPGFNFWLASRAQPRGFYTQQYMENRNMIFVTEWNQRVMQPQQFNNNLYELQIDYQTGIDYGYEVNYVLYNYFIYFQLTFNQKLGPFVPRI